MRYVTIVTLTIVLVKKCIIISQFFCVGPTIIGRTDDIEFAQMWDLQTNSIKKCDTPVGFRGISMDKFPVIPEHVKQFITCKRCRTKSFSFGHDCKIKSSSPE